MEARALQVRRRDVFQVARVDVAFRRLMAPALYRREPLETLVASLVGNITFRDLTAACWSTPPTSTPACR